MERVDVGDEEGWGDGDGAPVLVPPPLVPVADTDVLGEALPHADGERDTEGEPLRGAEPEPSDALAAAVTEGEPLGEPLLLGERDAAAERVPAVDTVAAYVVGAAVNEYVEVEDCEGESEAEDEGAPERDAEGEGEAAPLDEGSPEEEPEREGEGEAEAQPDGDGEAVPLALAELDCD